MNTVIVIGVGNEFRCDDAVGLEVVRRLGSMDLPRVELAECDGEPTGLIDLWARVDTAVVVDAVRLKGPCPGRVHRISAHHPSATPSGIANTHGIGLGDAVALAHALDQLPQRLLLYAVEVEDTGFGTGLTPDVAAAVPVVTEEIGQLLINHLAAEDVA